jgi:UDP-3-O-[3-hydroxymyristoyl] N-acetylglucosamine deacetylase
MHAHQKTIKRGLLIRGKGLHTGQMIDATLKPMPIDSGIWFKRTDLGDSKPILASVDNVADASLATTIGDGEKTLGTLEHLLAALGGVGVNNIMVEIDGPEVPILDGSAEPWVNLLRGAGFQTLNAARSYYKVVRPLKLEDGDKFLLAEPGPGFSVDFTIDFPGFINTQRRRFKFSEAAFVKEISPARTFCLLKDVEEMKRRGKALGGGLDNAVVIGDDGVLNPEGLRFPDECARHKILDFIGDLSLAQAPILGHFTAYKAGHALNHRFLATLLNEPGYLEKINPNEAVARPARNFKVALSDLNPLPIGVEGKPFNPVFAH